MLLLGDSTYDPRNFTGTSQPSPLPALWTKTSYLWTVSDPQLAAVNGEDALPDLAIGRLPATTVEQAQTLVEKLLGVGGLGPGPLGAGGCSWPTTRTSPATSRPTCEDIAQSFLAGASERAAARASSGPRRGPRSSTR